MGEDSWFVSKADIIEMRGGEFPGRCDYCGWTALPPMDEQFLEPEEGGTWACWHCLWRWDSNNIARALTPIFGPPHCD